MKSKESRELHQYYLDPKLQYEGTIQIEWVETIQVVFELSTVDPWTTQGLGALTHRAVENPRITFDSPQNVTNSLLFTGSLTDNINGQFTFNLSMLHTLFLE